jgi:hypothetical protein
MPRLEVAHRGQSRHPFDPQFAVPFLFSPFLFSLT